MGDLVSCSAMDTTETRTKVLIGNSFPFSLVRCERLVVESKPLAALREALADAEVISGLVNLYKPEKPIYDLAAQRMGLPPERLLFLDDTPSNVDAARSYGWQSEIYPPSGEKI